MDIEINPREIAKIHLQQQFAQVVAPAANKLALTKDEYLNEVLLATRMAINECEFTAGMKGYETLGKAQGYLQPEGTTINIAVAPDDVLAARARLEREVECKTIDTTAETILE
jgi:hypothetical protein